MRSIEDSIAKCSMMAAGIELGSYEAIDMFTVPEMWLVIADGLWACLELMANDPEIK